MEGMRASVMLSEARTVCSSETGTNCAGACEGDDYFLD